MGVRALVRVAAGIAFPRACAWCREPDAELLCERCALTAAPAPLRDLPPFERTVAAFAHEGAPRAALLEAKLGGERRGLPSLARRIPLVAGVDVVTAVPDTYRTRAQRGGSIAGSLARSYARRIETPFMTLLRKPRATSDHGGADRAQRWTDQRDAYVPLRAPPPRVALVDDVVTTGATATSCASALVAAGARSVILVTFTAAVLRHPHADNGQV